MQRFSKEILADACKWMMQADDWDSLTRIILLTLTMHTSADRAHLQLTLDATGCHKYYGMNRNGELLADLSSDVEELIQAGGECVVSLAAADQDLGWLSLEKVEGEPTSGDLDLLNGLALLAATQIHRLLEVQHYRTQVEVSAFELDREITDRRTTEAALARRAEQVEIIHRIGMAITSGLDLSEVLWELFRQCKQVVQVDVFYVALYDAIDEMLTFPLFLDQERPVNIQARSISKEPSLTGYIVQTRKTFYSPDTTSPDANLPVNIIRRGGSSTKTFLGIPLIWRDQIIGILSVQSYLPDAYPLDHIQLMETIATQAAGALEHARLFAEAGAAREATEKANRDLQNALVNMEILATTDKLTGTYNRRKFDEIIELEIKRVQRYKTPLSILILDIDHFKQLNDTYGHHVGDQVLRSFSRLLRENIRTSDTLTRWGGDEIIVLTPGIDLPQARSFAEKLRQLVEAHGFGSHDTLHCTLSIGVAQFLPGESGDDFLRRADTALYQAKANGRNCVVEIQS